MAGLRRILVCVTLVPLLAACGDQTEPPFVEVEAVEVPDIVTPTPIGDGGETPEADPSPTVMPSPSATAAPSPPPPLPEECVAQLPLRAQLGQLLGPLVVQSDLPTAVGLANFGAIGAVTLLGTPDEGLPDQLAELQAAAGPTPVLVMVDEEGGTVQRLAGLVGRLPSARSFAAQEPEIVQRRMEEHARQLLELGVTVDLAPVVDVGSGPGIGDRSYGDSAADVIAYAGAAASGLIDGGVLPVLKHFPGHGRASGDSHDGLPQTPPLRELEASDLLPFDALTDELAVAVMVGHLEVPDLTDGLPASLSPAAVNGLLRTDLGFDGLVVTDAFNMGALAGWTDAEAAELAIAAGNDIAMLTGVENVPAVLDHLEAAVLEQRLDPAAVVAAARRVLAAKGVDPCSLVG